MKQRWRVSQRPLEPKPETPILTAFDVEAEQVVDTGETFDLPIHAARGLSGTRYYVRQPNGRQLFLEVGDWVIRKPDGQFLRVDDDAFRYLVVAPGDQLP